MGTRPLQKADVTNTGRKRPPTCAAISTYEADGAQHAAPLQRRRKKSSEVADDFAGGIGAAGAGQAVAGMRAGAAKKKTADGRFVTRPIENGTHSEKLIDC